MRRNRQSGPRSGFSLVELLVVIGIMGMLMAIALPAFHNFGQGSAMRSAVAQVRSTLSLARQYAITHSISTRFIVAGPNEGYGAYTNEVDKCLRAYAVFDFTNHKYLTPWEYLPDGIIFDYRVPSPAVDSSGAEASIFNYLYSGSHYDLEFPNSQSTTKRAFHAVQFRSDGRAAWGGGGNADRGAVLLTEGAVLWDPGGAVDVDDDAQYHPTPNGRRKIIYVYQRAGRIEVEDVL